jgi:hypothetical protein
MPLRNGGCRTHKMKAPLLAQRDQWGSLGIGRPLVRAQNAWISRDPLVNDTAKDRLGGPASRVIGLLRKASHEIKECFRLANEDIHVHKTLQSDGGSVLGRRWTDDRTHW